MSEPKLISPLLDNYIIGDPISEKQGVRCCPALEKDLQTKCIVKIISTPTSQAQLDALLLTGAYKDAQDALEYFKHVAESIVDEAKILQRLASLEGFFSYTNWQLVPMTDGIGFDVYALSEYRKTLAKLLKSGNMTHLSAVNLALDLCTALAVCRRIGYLYVNLKPDNIYLAENNTWKIGDIGFINLSSLKYASLPERYRSEYTAPEIADAFAALNTTMDVYALGLVLYRIYNGNQMPANIGNPDGEALLPPDYADYEMSEIILKACDPDPVKRWQDPIELGQALVSYMQRNGVNDTPIIPPVVVPPVTETVNEGTELSETPVENNGSPTESNEANNAAVNESESKTLAEDIQTNLNMQDADPDLAALLSPSNDETSPDQSELDLAEIGLTDEVTDMLSQADDLIAHPTPDMDDVKLEEENKESEENSGPVAPVVAPPEEEVPTREEPISDESVLEETTPVPESTTNASKETPSAEEETEISTNVTATDTEEDQDINTAAPVQVPEQSPAEDAAEDTQLEEDNTPPLASQSHWLRNLLIGVSVLILAALAFLFYTKCYVQTIDSLEIEAAPNGKVIVELATQCEASKLSVVCTDAYGNPRTVAVESDGTNKIAVFDNLAPGSAYAITVKIDGLHTLKGHIEDRFNTPNEIQIVQFDAVTGNEDGSVILSFSVKDQDSENWNITYTADDSSEQVIAFTGHICNIGGLTVGNEYTFKLAPETDIKYKGITEVTHTASSVIIPENLQILSILDGKLTASWTAPDGVAVSTWRVHCHNESGFEYITDVEGTTVSIDGIDATAAHTLEVAASGMSVTARADAPANAITVTDFKASEDSAALNLSWACANQNAPTGWILTCSIDGSMPKEYTCQEAAFLLENPIPASEYTFVLKTQDGEEVLGGKLVHTTVKLTKFAAYNVTASNMHFYSCRTPKKTNWSKKDLAASDYTSTFQVGEKISFLVELKETYNPSKDEVTTMFVFRDENGAVVESSTFTSTWKQMWYKGLCELDVPSVPSTPGQYTVTIFMNGKYAGESKITIA